MLPEGPAIQSDNFKEDCENPLSHISFKSTVWKTVGNSHICDNSYIESRGFADWTYLFRVSERRGCLACGVNADGKRGIIQSPMLSKITDFCDIRVSFRIRPDADMSDNVCFKVILSGVIRKAELNGTGLEVSKTHEGIEHSLTIPCWQMVDGWNEVSVDIEKASSGTMLYWAGESSDKKFNHGFYLDDINVVRTASMERAKNNLRVLFWNIQNGMWSDQEADFANFRDFVKRYDPDVCVWCEAQSIYKSRSTSTAPASERYFPEGWKNFAGSYGHSYTAIGGYRYYADDYYPQVITSKFPIETILRITETDEEHSKLALSYESGKSYASEYHKTCTEDYCPVAHGAGVFRINANGKNVNFVSLHLWPHAYSYYAKFVSKQTSDPQSVGGNRQRLEEIKYICSRTIDNPELSSETNWLMMGDFNTRSRLDNWFYGLSGDSPLLSSHDYILDHTFYKDIIGLGYPGHFFSTRTWANDAGGTAPPRYDFMYASPEMFARVKNAVILNESWTNMVWAMSNYYDTSDHRPILVDFDLSK